MKTDSEKSVFAAINAATGKELALAMQDLCLTGRVLPVGATLQVRHVFTCAEKKPVEVIYAFGLPRDAALRRFRIVGQGFSALSELQPTAAAVKTYEAGIAEGHLASLARQYRDGVVNLSVGNVRPGETVAVYLELLAGVERRDDGLRFRFPFTLAPTYHAKARTIEAEPGVGEMELPEAFGDVILPRWMKEARDLHRVSFDLAVTLPQAVAELGSPSHAIKVCHQAGGQYRVSLAPEKDAPDRDLVLDVRAQEPLAGLTGGIGKDGHGHFALVLPSAAFGKTELGPRRIVFVMDRSGSMDGGPMAQAKQAVEACLGALSARDAFGVVAFDDHVESLAAHLLDGAADGREAAKQFLKTVDARGGTELAQGFLAAAALLGKGGGDVLILTDGQVSDTDAILAQARAAGIRIHCLGIGSASQDRFLTLLARETGGVSRFLTARERVDMAAVELFAGIGSPLAQELQVTTADKARVTLAPEPPSAVFAGNPWLVFGETEGAVATSLHLAWRGPDGPHQLDVPVKLKKSEDAETVRLLQGARLITDMEARLEAAPGPGPIGRRTASRQSKALEKLSTQYGLASQAMSLVAVVKRKGDKAGDVPKTVVVPVGMPQDTAFAAYFGAPASQQVVCCMDAAMDLGEPMLRRSRLSDTRMFARFQSIPATPKPAPRPEDVLMELASRIEPDGGLPGKDAEERWVATALALLAFLAEGHTAQSGAFRAHVSRLIAFLQAAPATAADPQKQKLMALAAKGTALSGDWLTRARTLLRRKHPAVAGFWKDVARALATP